MFNITLKSSWIHVLFHRTARSAKALVGVLICPSANRKRDLASFGHPRFKTKVQLQTRDVKDLCIGVGFG